MISTYPSIVLVLSVRISRRINIERKRSNEKGKIGNEMQTRTMGN